MKTNDDECSSGSDCSSPYPGGLTPYEWIDYWSSGNAAHVADGYEIDPSIRLDLAWAAQSLNHLLATMRAISVLDYSHAAINGAAYDAVLFAKNALAEYQITE